MGGLAQMKWDAVRAEMREIMGKAWDSTDNRMGQLVYDNLFWNKTMKDLSMASVRSLGWNIGTFRELGGGVIDFGKQGMNLATGKKAEMTHRMAYTLALPILTGVIGAMIQKLSTGETPTETKDYFFPRVGGTDENGDPIRVSIPSYMKDVYHYSQHPVSTVVNKMNPLINVLAETYSNKDFYGKQVYGEEDGAFKKGMEVMAHFAKAFEPFTARNIKRELDLGQSPAKALSSFVGITPAPADVNKTPAELLASEIYGRNRPIGGKTQAEADRSTLLAKIRNAMAHGNNQPAVEALSKGDISPSDLKNISKQSHVQPLIRLTYRMSISDTIHVWDKADDAEKQLLRPVLMKKWSAESNHPANERAAIRTEMKKRGIF